MHEPFGDRLGQDQPPSQALLSEGIRVLTHSASKFSSGFSESDLVSSNKIVADSLTESLREFQAAIAPWLERGKAEQWDGKTLLKREKKIREAALILGGKCIGICTLKNYLSVLKN